VNIKQQVTFFKILVTHFHTSYEQRKGRSSDYCSTDSTLERWLNAIARDIDTVMGHQTVLYPSVCAIMDRHYRDFIINLQ